MEDADFKDVEEGLSVTVSIGITQYEHGESIETTLSRADGALYSAKEMGRNKVVSRSAQ